MLNRKNKKAGHGKNWRRGIAFLMDAMSALIIVMLVFYALAALNDADKRPTSRAQVLAYAARDLGNALEQNGTLDKLFALDERHGEDLLNSTINASLPNYMAASVTVGECTIHEVKDNLDCKDKCELLGYQHEGTCKNVNPGCNAQGETYEQVGDRYCNGGKICCCKDGPGRHPFVHCAKNYTVSFGDPGDAEVGVSRRVFTDRNDKFGFVQIEVWRK
ncbi:Uncharacterised protein [Candidatus Gugararchaeum adminiculabundum]|nr:Uncharacterised protein [Candidatus Gugararchaeum adminiculabundum]